MPPRFLSHLAIGVLALLPLSVRADEPPVPGDGYAAARYETLWTKSPFAVATSEDASESADYAMVGLAQLEGVSYVNLIDKQSNEHFLLSSDKPVRGLTLVSIAHGHDASDTSAVVQKKGGETITLKLEEVSGGAGMPGPPGAPAMANAAPGTLNSQNVMAGNRGVGTGGTFTPQNPIPGGRAPMAGAFNSQLPTFGGLSSSNSASTPPPVHARPRTILLPPPPTAQSQPASSP